jgi:hypothetical protein
VTLLFRLMFIVFWWSWHDSEYSNQLSRANSTGIWNTFRSVIQNISSVFVSMSRERLYWNNFNETSENVSHYQLIFYFSSTELRRNGILSRISSKTIPKTTHNVEDMFSAIEFKSLVPLYTALVVGVMAAILILIGEIMLKYVLSKMRPCTLGIKI